jgi:hypothetical protein
MFLILRVGKVEELQVIFLCMETYGLTDVRDVRTSTIVLSHLTNFLTYTVLGIVSTQTHISMINFSCLNSTL